MPRTVLDGIQRYLMDLAPLPAEVEKRQSHKRTIEQALVGEFPAFNSVQVIGSHTRSSAIHIFSDVDYFAMLGKTDIVWGNGRVNSGTTLKRVKAALDLRFHATDVRIDGPAVVVGFGGGAGAVDVVPGIFQGMTNTSPQYPVYLIPDGTGGWTETSPQRHSKYIRDEDTRSGNKLARTIQLLKGWKYARLPKVPVLGFHLEMLLANQEICVGPRAYQNCLLDAFRLLRDRRGAAIIDPVGIAGYIAATGTDAQRQQLVDHAAYAAEKASAAIDAEIAGDIDGAFYYWGLVFNGAFPGRR